MAQIPHKASNVQRGKVGVESLWGFGDLCFNAPLIKAIADKHNCKVDVVTASRCKDALINLPWVGQTHITENLNHGIKLLKSKGYEHTYQITQNVKFYEFKKTNSNHSLIHTPKKTGEQLGLPEFDIKPIFRPTDQELQTAKSYLNSDKFVNNSFGRPLIAIESVFNSAQSWANIKDIASITNRFRKTHHILWLSNHGAPNVRYVDDMLHFTRRECIACFPHIEHFFSVGSGFFCAALGLRPSLQPPKITCLWNDALYKYEKPIAEQGWHQSISWIHDRNELLECLKQ